MEPEVSPFLAERSFMLGPFKMQKEMLTLLDFPQLRIGASERAVKGEMGPCRFPCNCFPTL